MQAAIDDIPAKEIHEDPGTAEEDNGTKNKSAVIDREDHVVLSEVEPLTTRWSKRGKQSQGDDGNQCQQVKQNRSPAQKVLLNLEAKYSANLSPPERPREWVLLNFRWFDIYN